MKRILVIRTHRLGDVLQLTPMLAGLKERYPAAKITLVTGDNLADVMQDQPYIDELVGIPESRYRADMRHGTDSRAPIYNELYEGMAALQQRKFDLVVNRQYEPGALIAWLSGADDVRGGAFSPEQDFYFADRPSAELFEIIKTDRRRNSRNLVDWACLIAGVSPGSAEMNIRLSAADRWEAADLLMQHGISRSDSPVAIQMGAARAFRHWGANRYAQLIRHLLLDRKFKIVLLGTMEEKPLADAVREMLPDDIEGLIDLTGKTSLRVLGGVLQRCRLLITGDTGTMHLATTVGTRVLAIFYGTAYPWETGPYGNGHLILFADEPCAPCIEPASCYSGQHCRDTITPEHVLAAFDVAEHLQVGTDGTVPEFGGNTRLFITRITPGTGQSLIPIDREMLQGRNESKQTRRSTAVDNEILLDYLNRLKHCESNLMHDYYLGDRDAFAQSFSRYTDQWLKLVRFVNTAVSADAIRGTLAAGLMPSLQQAMQAMQDNDIVTIKDVVWSQLACLIQTLAASTDLSAADAGASL